MSAGDRHSILYRGVNPLDEKFKARYDPSKKEFRYRAGQVPHYLDEAEEAEELHGHSSGAVQPPTDVTQDPRVQRLLAAQQNTEPRGSRRRKVEAVLLSTSDEIPEPPIETADDAEPETLAMEPATEGEDDGGNSLDERTKLRQAALAKRLEEEAALEREQQFADEDEVEEEMEFEEEELTDGRILRRPKFVAKGSRESLREREALELEAKIKTEKEKTAAAERVTESKQMLQSAMETDDGPEMSFFDLESDPEMPDDDDNEYQEEEYELWKIRELRRLKRDREEAEERWRLQAEIERRRNMNDVERRADDAILDAQQPVTSAPRQKYQFLQKYYHKGAFFQDKAKTGAEPIYIRDFNEPIAADRVDKSALPKPMQLRRGLFGRSGQVKHTHLADVDTTDFNSAWVNRPSGSKAGVKWAAECERPKRTKPKQ